MPIEEKPAATAVDREAEAAALQAAIRAEAPPTGTSPGPDEDEDGTATPPQKPKTGAKSGGTVSTEATEGWQPFARGPNDYPHPRNRPEAPPTPYFSDADLQLLDKPRAYLSAKLKRERKRLINRKNEIREAYEIRQHAAAATAAHEALRQRHLQSLPADAVAQAGQLDGREIPRLWNGGVELLELTTGKDLRVEARIGSRTVSSTWTEAEQQQLAPVLLELYVRYPSLAEWARTLGGPELRLLLLLGPIALAKVALVGVMLRGAKATDPKPDAPDAPASSPEAQAA